MKTRHTNLLTGLENAFPCYALTLGSETDSAERGAIGQFENGLSCCIFVSQRRRGDRGYRKTIRIVAGGTGENWSNDIGLEGGIG